MSAQQTISYAQRYEDMHLLRAFGEQASGFYIDIGAGHPVYDNVSFAFYLRGWSGITVEPNPWLAQLSESVRPLDVRIPSLIGEKPGTATYYLVEDFHGLSTTIEGHARAAEIEYGKLSRTITMPVRTLLSLCEQFVPGAIDFLKIDVEGAERAVLLGGDWRRFRPKIVVAEALAPVTMAPAWDTWEPLLLESGYRFACFDSLNRYYVAEEYAALAAKLAAVRASFDGVTPFRQFKPALDDTSHPDHGLARLLDGMDMVRLPLMPLDAMAERIIKGLDPTDLAKPATAADLAAAHHRLFGTPATAAWPGSLNLAAHATVRDLYRSAVATAPFRAACGRISASSAW
jgi:FkbM family methyltransferase